MVDAYEGFKKTSYKQAFESGSTSWDRIVKENSRQMKTQLDIPAAGAHTLKIYMVDPAIVLEKIVLSSGALPKTYFGPKFNTPVKTK